MDLMSLVVKPIFGWEKLPSAAALPSCSSSDDSSSSSTSEASDASYLEHTISDWTRRLPLLKPMSL